MKQQPKGKVSNKLCVKYILMKYHDLLDLWNQAD